DILIPPYTISGPQSVIVAQTGVTYSVTNTSGSTYYWTVPAGATIVSGQGTNFITVNFGTQAGYVEVTETQSNNCLNGPSKLYVSVDVVGVGNYYGEEIRIYQPDGKSFFIKSKSERSFVVKLVNSLGEIVFDEKVLSNSSVQLNLPNGIYMAELNGQNSLSAKKILIIN
ncbi:MAG: T9SS type A sorting domain-containing protein, partial [Bacteroidia bacterium]